MPSSNATTNIPNNISNLPMLRWAIWKCAVPLLWAAVARARPGAAVVPVSAAGTHRHAESLFALAPTSDASSVAPTADGEAAAEQATVSYYPDWAEFVCKEVRDPSLLESYEISLLRNTVEACCDEW